MGKPIEMNDIVRLAGDVYEKYYPFLDYVKTEKTDVGLGFEMGWGVTVTYGRKDLAVKKIFWIDKINKLNPLVREESVLSGLENMADELATYRK